MFISEYIIYGGKNLTTQKTVNFPENAEDIFWKIQRNIVPLLVVKTKVFLLKQNMKLWVE